MAMGRVADVEHTEEQVMETVKMVLIMAAAAAVLEEPEVQLRLEGVEQMV